MTSYQDANNLNLNWIKKLNEINYVPQQRQGYRSIEVKSPEREFSPPHTQK